MRRRKIIIICVMTVTFAVSLCFSSAETKNGYIDIKANIPNEFEHSIMINLLDKDKVNYIVVAEPINNWDATTELPVGEYTIEYVSFEKADSKYKIEYEEHITIKENIGSDFFVSVSKNEETHITGDKSDLDRYSHLQEVDNRNYSPKLLSLILNIVKKNYISIIIIICLIVHLYKSRRKKRHEQNY